MDIVLFGIQGSGKGTQAKLISEKYNFKIFETGAKLREVALQQNEFGKKINSILISGQLVPTELVIQILEKFLSEISRTESVIFDGIPRNSDQKNAFDQIMSKYKRSFIGINISVPEKITIQRILSRGRNDDNELAIINRIKLFKEQTLPIINDYKKNHKLLEINGTKTINEVFQDIDKIISQNL